MSYASTHQNLYLIIIVLFGIGFFSSIQLTFMNILNFVDIDKRDISKATSISSVFQQISSSFGVCLSAALLIILNALGTNINNQYGTTNWLGGTINTNTFADVLIGLSIVCLLSLTMFTKLKPEDGVVVTLHSTTANKTSVE